MSDNSPPFELGPQIARSDLETVLAAWQDATVQLEQTHRALRDEVCRLTDELEIKNRELARQNRLADLGQMASHIAHEVRNNLVPVSLYLSLLRRRLASQPGTVDLLAKIEGGVTALDAMVNDLLHFTADREPKLTSFALAELAHDVIAPLEPQLTAQAIQVESRIDASIRLWADRDMLRRAVLNLVLNAVDVLSDGGQIELAATIDHDVIELSVADSGPGISDEVQRRVFEPFFTTKSTGTGLGLAIVFRVAEAHGGMCRVANRPQGGAEFTLRLPHHTVSEIAA